MAAYPHETRGEDKLTCKEYCRGLIGRTDNSYVEALADDLADRIEHDLEAARAYDDAASDWRMAYGE